MIEKVVNYLGEKLIDKITSGTLDIAIDNSTKKMVSYEYEKIKNTLYDNLTKDKEESYYDNMIKLLDQTTILKDIFNFCYLFDDLSSKEQKLYLKEKINDFFHNKTITSDDLSIIEGKIYSQYDYCYSNINRLDDTSRKLLNHVLFKIADDTYEQNKLLHLLQCDMNELKKIVVDIKQFFQGGDVDLEYISQLTKMSIDNLNIRFHKDFNIDVELEQELARFCNILENKKKIYKMAQEVYTAIQFLNIGQYQSLLNKWKYLIEKINNNEIFDCSLLRNETEKYIEESDKIIKSMYQSSTDYYKSNNYNAWRHLCFVNSNLDEYREALESDVIIITGDAGVGKSHSIAHFIFNEYYLKKEICIFVLGQHMNQESNPLKMLEELLHLPYTLQRFLDELNKIAEKNKKYIPFVIEGINEGYHSEIWNDYFNGIINIFENYNYIKLVISIRKTYIKRCLPDGYEKRTKTLIIEHKGFENNANEAIAEFFDYYGINKPTFPIVYADFYNPLFLHTLCKTLKNSTNVKIEEYSSFNDIFKEYINVVEKSVATNCKYTPGLKLVNKSVNNIIKYSLSKNIRYGIKIDEFYTIVKKVTEPFEVPLNTFINSMIENGLFYSEIYDDEEYIQFAYERYHNILCANYLLENIDSVSQLRESVNNGQLKQYFKRYSTGIIEELFIIIPEKYNIELLDIIVDESKAKNVIDAFIKSLIWRKGTKIPIDETKKMINKYVIKNKRTFQNFLNTLFIIAPIENHPLNAMSLHKYLSKFKMAARDEFWIECISNDINYNGVLNNILHFSESQKTSYSQETKLLIGIIITWSLATTNNYYRENAIRSLTKLLENDLIIANNLLKKFIDVDDGYIREGLYCSLYGATLRCKNLTGAESLAKTIYNDIFIGEEVYPHIIVRDHARGIIDYLHYRGISLSLNIDKIVPPYNSKWYDKIPTSKDIEKFKFDYSDTNESYEKFASNRIISSMATNTGENPGAYGDFGRYIFEGWVEPWNHHFIAQDLSNIVIKIIFEQYGYDYKKHGIYDSTVEEFSRHNHKNERIGKKYQRIASFEMLARLSDNFEPGEIEIEYDDNKNNFDFDKFLDSINYENEDDCYDSYKINKIERREIFKPYEYKGPWQFNYRGIDPTILTNSVSDKKNLWDKTYVIPHISGSMWANKDTPEPDLQDILFIQYLNEDYVVLKMYNTWKDEHENVKIENKNTKEYFFRAIAMFAPLEYDFNKKSYLKCFDNIIHNHGSYTIFAREYYWSNAYKDYKIQLEKDYGDDLEKELIDTGFDYESPISYSEETNNIISSYSIPSKYIVEKLNLVQLEDGKWYNKNNELVSLDIKVDGYNSALIIKYDTVKKLLEDENLILIWGIYTEKKSYPQYYETRKIAKWDGNNFSFEQYEERKWNSKY